MHHVSEDRFLLWSALHPPDPCPVYMGTRENISVLYCRRLVYGEGEEGHGHRVLHGWHILLFPMCHMHMGSNRGISTLENDVQSDGIYGMYITTVQRSLPIFEDTP